MGLTGLLANIVVRMERGGCCIYSLGGWVEWMEHTTGTRITTTALQGVCL